MRVETYCRAYARLIDDDGTELARDISPDDAWHAKREIEAAVNESAPAGSQGAGQQFVPN